MKFRIKQKGDLEYAKYYPQKKGWKTLWHWDYFHVSYWEVPTYAAQAVRTNVQRMPDEYTALFYKTYNEAEKYIEKYKAKHFTKEYEIVDKQEERKRKILNLRKKRS